MILFIVFDRDVFRRIYYLTKVGQYHGNIKLASIVVVSSGTTFRGKLTNMSAGGSIGKDCSYSRQMLEEIE